jgi:hypothetical protein
VVLVPGAAWAENCLTQELAETGDETPSFDLLIAFLSHPLGLATVAVTVLGNVTKRRLVAKICAAILLSACLLAALLTYLDGEKVRETFITACAGDPWLIVFLLFVVMNSVGFRVPKV